VLSQDGSHTIPPEIKNIRSINSSLLLHLQFVNIASPIVVCHEIIVALTGTDG